MLHPPWRSRLAVVEALPLIVIIACAFFFRSLVVPIPGTGFGIQASTLLVLGFVVAAACLALRVIASGSILETRIALGWGLLAVLVVAVALGATLQYGRGMLNLRVAAEMLLSLFMIPLFHRYVRDREGFERLLIGLLVVCVGASLYYWSVFLGGSNAIRRLSLSRDVTAIAAVNHLGHAYGTACVVAAAGAMAATTRRARSTFLLALGVNLPILFLLGSRSSAIGLGVALLIVMAVRARSARTWLRYGGALLAVAGVVAVLLVVFADRIRKLLERFTLAQTLIALEGRQEVVAGGVEILFEQTRLSTALIGIGLDRYVDSGMRAYGYQPPDPHSMWVSMFLFFGLLAGAVFVFLVARVSLRLLRLAMRASPEWHFVVHATLGALVITGVYASVSGRLTKVVTIFVVLGMAEWLVSRHRDAVRPPTSVPAGS